MAVRENQNISLTCKADGFPTPKIMWRREDGQAISVERRKKGEFRQQLTQYYVCSGKFPLTWLVIPSYLI